MRRSLCLLTLCAVPTFASPSCFDDAMLVLDGSWSMAETGFGENALPKIAEARKAIATVAPEAALNRDIGLVTYGPGGTDDCTGITLHFPPTRDSADDIVRIAGQFAPSGSTPLTQSVGLAAQAMPDGGTVVLITDGAETCKGSPCAMGAALADRYTVHVIGFQVKGNFREWQSVDPNDFFIDEDPDSRCMADLTGGEYVGAQSLDDLILALRVTLGCGLIG